MGKITVTKNILKHRHKSTIKIRKFKERDGSSVTALNHASFLEYEATSQEYLYSAMAWMECLAILSQQFTDSQIHASGWKEALRE